MNRFIKYLHAVVAEMKHVSWPTTKQAVIYTALVIGITIIVAAIVGVFDYLFSYVLGLFV